MKKQRKHYAPEEKVAILRRHFLEKEPISKLCDEVGTPADGLLPLAEGVLRERSCCIRAESTAEPFRRAGADRLPGKKDPDQGRGSRLRKRANMPNPVNHNRASMH